MKPATKNHRADAGNGSSAVYCAVDEICIEKFLRSTRGTGLREVRISLVGDTVVRVYTRKEPGVAGAEWIEREQKGVTPLRLVEYH